MADNATNLHADIENIEAEASLLGALLSSGQDRSSMALLERALDKLQPDSFFEPVHGRIFAAIQWQAALDRPVSPVTIFPIMDPDPGLEDLGGKVYLARLTADPAGFLLGEALIDQTIDLAKRRQMRDRLIEAVKMCSDVTTPIQQITEVADHALQIDESDDVGTASTQIETDKAYEAAMCGPKLGFDTDGRMELLDALIGPYVPGALIVVAARPGMGKSGLMVSSSIALAQAGHGVMMVSLEMTREELYAREIADVCFDEISGEGVEHWKVKSPNTYGEARDRINLARQRLRGLPIIKFDGAGVTLSRIDREIRRAKRTMANTKTPLKAVFVDHLGLLNTDHRSRSEYEKISDLSRGMKVLAKKHGVTIFLLCQLSRAVEQREDKRPQLSDLRDSGQIEQDADVVLFMLRRAYYHKMKEPQKGTSDHAAWQLTYNEIENDLELICSKKRGGKTGTERVRFYGEFQAIRASKIETPAQRAMNDSW